MLWLICAYIIFKKNYKPNFLVILFSEAGMVAFVFACIVMHFPSKPKHPPSITSTMERTAFLPSVLSICTNPQVRIGYSQFAIICMWHIKLYLLLVFINKNKNNLISGPFDDV